DGRKGLKKCDKLGWVPGAGLIQKKGRGMHSGRARGRVRATHIPNSGFNTTCWRCGEEGHFDRPQDGN
uniref:CCHC-type domain-containing protein n=1 Tax=Maylandia zebra TaxID=106582 RepID=A0A3P9DAB5_9CICH